MEIDQLKGSLILCISEPNFNDIGRWLTIGKEYLVIEVSNRNHYVLIVDDKGSKPDWFNTKHFDCVTLNRNIKIDDILS